MLSSDAPKNVLAVSIDAEWLKYVSLALDGKAIVHTASTLADAVGLLSRARSKPDGLIVNIAAVSREEQYQTVLNVADFLLCLEEERFKDVVAWFSRPVAIEGLSRLIGRSRQARFLADDTMAALDSVLLPARSAPAIQPIARVEVEIGAADLRVVVANKGQRVTELRQSWAGRRKLRQLEKRFKSWPLWQERGDGRREYTDRWEETFREVGEDLAYEIAYSEQMLRNAIDTCVLELGSTEHIHFCFSLVSDDAGLDHPLVNVPFELLYDDFRRNYLRAISPVARQIKIPTSSRLTPVSACDPWVANYHGPVVFIASNAYGAYRGSAATFGSKSLVLAPLKTLLDEQSGVVEAWANDKPDSSPNVIALEPGRNAKRLLKEEFRRLSRHQPRMEIVHYAGHSVRADDGSVFLVVPSIKKGEVDLIHIEEFAQWLQAASILIVVMSSCESSTPDAIFRLTQAGIPAAIGFRWQVDDREAPIFARHLHKCLASGESLAASFHHAIQSLYTNDMHSPTFASPMLVVQGEPA